ncbi:MAG: GTPase [Lacipirellulaceae bacterium]
MYDTREEIVAVATAPGGQAARSIVRVGGPNIVSLLRELFTPCEPIDLAAIRTARIVEGNCDIRLSDSEQLSIPCSLFLWPGSSSYTRQPIAEFHLPGSAPLADAVVQSLCAAGARLASAGEFTLRAFLGGRIDLTQAEAVLGVIDASDRSSLDAALTQLAGGLSGPLDELRNRLLNLLAELEAGLDFADEDIEFISREKLAEDLANAETVLQDALDQLRTRDASQQVPRVVLTGPPNAGKSSLFNLLAEKFATSETKAGAIVSEVAGTTRDYISAKLELGGFPIELIDTAGVEEVEQVDQDAIPSTQEISIAAQQAMRTQVGSASLILYCFPSDESLLVERDSITSPPTIRVATKCDLSGSGSPEFLACSSETGAGIDRLVAAIVERLKASDEPATGVASTAARCRVSLEQAQQSIEAAKFLCESGGEELISAELRTALDRLAEVVGAVYIDDILDRVFSQFCIGK